MRIHGVVQGVGFRYSARREACSLSLSGWVRNLPDGCVEVEFEGDTQQLSQFLDWCKHGPRGAQVDLVEMLTPTDEPEYRCFVIR